jgi:hypothetical protein
MGQARRKAQGQGNDGLIQLLLPVHIEKRHVINPDGSLGKKGHPYLTSRYSTIQLVANAF